VLDLENPEAALVFCRTRNEVDELAETVNAHGYRAEALHGAMSQEQRDRVMKRVRSGAADLLIATDVAARGLDIPRLTHVINYDVPSEPESYVHRIGRVGRAGREGVAITLAEPREHRQLRSIEQFTKQRIPVATMPTVEDLRARRLELVRASLREILVKGDLDRFRVVVESLADEFGPMEVAMAAVNLALDAADGKEKEPVMASEEAPRGEGERPRKRTFDKSPGGKQKWPRSGPQKPGSRQRAAARRRAKEQGR
jgi:ATP-dependent RNA helicase DeaD